MPLSDAQKQTLATAIRAETNQTVIDALAIGNTVYLTEWCNSASATDAWRPDAPVSAILNAISFSTYTPVDAPDTTVTYSNRILAIQTKQMNLQLMLMGQLTINATLPNVRSGLRDAVVALPAGTSGASVSAGGASGATVLAACIRKATNGEMYLGSSDATTGSTTAKIMNYYGVIPNSELSDALNRF